uniref:CSON000121 protein n=1 Tax=Culicoides sonorensis TaxID=179676 RepID=A0A336MGF8_CULSO
MEKVKFGNGHFCNAVLFAPRFAVTAAHCVQGIRKSGIIVVKNNRSLFRKTSKIEIFDIKKVILNEKYNARTKVNDIALLELQIHGRNETTSDLKPINEKFIMDFKSTKVTKCQIRGWGAVVKGLEISETLKTANVSLITPQLCNTTYPYVDIIRQGMFCAISFDDMDTGPCIGDSGGSLICENILIGIVSWGLESCQYQKAPTVYTNVGFFTNWIISKVTQSELVKVKTWQKQKKEEIINKKKKKEDEFLEYYEDGANSIEMQYLIHLNLIIIYFLTHL